MFLPALAAALTGGINHWKGWAAVKEVAVVEESRASAIREKIGLKLVGIDWAAVPVALVEDSSGKTHFLHQGDSVAGARVQWIFKDKVIFNTRMGRIALK